jgi:predicted N-acyltransferase
LHFNVCYYRGIEECIARGLDVFEPGAGGDHKLVRGFEPTITYSAHRLKHPVLGRAIKDFLSREQAAVCSELEEAKPVLRPIDD